MSSTSHSQSSVPLDTYEKAFDVNDLGFSPVVSSDELINCPRDWLLTFNKCSILRDTKYINHLLSIRQAIFPKSLEYLSIIANFNHRLRCSENSQDCQSLVAAFIRDIKVFPAAHRIYIAKSLFRSNAYLELLALDYKLAFEPPQIVEPCKRMIIAMMVKDEGDIIFSSLAHNFTLGCRSFFILLNGCNDNTLDEILRFQRIFPDAYVVFINDPIVAYYQKDKTSLLIDYALGYLRLEGPVPDIILPLDADEFFTFHDDNVKGYSDLFKCMDGSAFRALVIPLVDIGSEPSSSASSERSFYDSVSSIASPCSFSGTKVVFRSGRRNFLVQGNHFLSDRDFSPESYGASSMFGAYISHYQYRSIEHVKTKVRNGGIAYSNEKIDRNLGVHWRNDYQSMLSDADSFASLKMNSYLARIDNSHKLLAENQLATIYKSAFIRSPKER